MHNKSSIITWSAAVFVALITIAGISYFTYAASTNADSEASSSLPFFGRRMMNKNLTPEQKSALEAQWTAKNAEFIAKADAVKAALAANDYNAWVKAVGEGAPILQKIKADNFNRLVEAYGYKEKAQALMTELGIQGEGMFGSGCGRGGRGFWKNGGTGPGNDSINSGASTNNNGAASSVGI